jgi:hypothetical protein
MKVPKHVDIKIPTKLAIAGAIFSAIMGTLVACGGNMGVLSISVLGTSHTVHLSTSQRVGSHIFPGSSSKPFLASVMMFATAPTPSRLQQSYDAVCNFQPGFLGFVAQGSLVPLAMAGENNSCAFFSGPSGDGKQTIFDGELSSLVVTGKTVSGTSFQCRDVDTTASVLDNSFTRAYLDPNTHTVAVFNALNGTITRVPFACSGIGSDADQVATIEVQWAKI